MAGADRARRVSRAQPGYGLAVRGGARALPTEPRHAVRLADPYRDWPRDCDCRGGLCGDRTRHGDQRGRIPHSLRRFADRKSTRLNSSHVEISYAVFCLKKKKKKEKKNKPKKNKNEH